jgi:CRP-like cAMP-binding protein
MPSRRNLDAQLRSALVALGSTHTYQRGEYLCLEGDDAHHLYVVRSGLMRVERATKQGRVVLLALYGPGDIFGELAVLDGSVRSASAKVIETVEAQVVPAQQVTALLLAEPEVLLSLTKSIVSRLRELTDQLVQSGERSISSRVAARLVAIIDSSGYGEETNEFSLRMPISQEELGEWSGLSREATAKALRELRTLGVLSTGRQRLQVHEPDRLRAIAERGE